MRSRLHIKLLLLQVLSILGFLFGIYSLSAISPQQAQAINTTTCSSQGGTCVSAPGLWSPGWSLPAGGAGTVWGDQRNLDSLCQGGVSNGHYQPLECSKPYTVCCVPNKTQTIGNYCTSYTSSQVFNVYNQCGGGGNPAKAGGCATNVPASTTLQIAHYTSGSSNCWSCTSYATGANTCPAATPGVTSAPTSAPTNPPPPTNPPTQPPAPTSPPATAPPPGPTQPPASNTTYDNCLFTQGSNQVLPLACLPNLVANIIAFGLDLAGTVCVIIIIVSGIKMILARGDPKEIILSKNSILYAVVGLFIVLLSFFILETIGKVTGATCITMFNADFGNCHAP